MSGPVVLIGYIILIPCVILMALGIMTTFASGDSHNKVSSEIESEFQKAIDAAGIPKEIADQAIKAEGLSEDQKQTLTDEQSSALNSATTTRSAGMAGASIGAGIGGLAGVGLTIGSFVGGLLGWLLIMKKKVLQCNACQSVVAAS